LAELFGTDPPDPEEAKAHLHKVLPEAVRLLSMPSEVLGSISRWKKGGASVPAFGRLALRPPDRRTRLRGSLGVDKRAAWSAPISMRDVDFVRQALGGTVNDVLTNAVAGGLRRYLAERGDLRPRLSIRAIVPVSLRPLEEMSSLGNQFGLVFLSLPVGIEDCRQRLAEVRRRMGRLKRSFEPVVAMRIMAALGASPKRVQDLIVRIFGAKGTAVLTNVPGPRQRLHFAGKAMSSFMFWVPQSARLGMGLSILSYAGQVRIGVATDAGLVPDPEAVIAGMHREFEVMSRLADEMSSPAS
jgi:WS/DGAT/MGAT family acyltransferase